MKCAIRFLRREEGAAFAEFALAAVFILLPVLFGIIEFGRLAWTKNMVTAAAREGVRYAIVHGASSGSVADTPAVESYVKGRTALSPIDVVPTWTGTKEPGKDTATVRVTYTYTPIVKVPGLLNDKTVTGISKQIIAF